MWDSYDSPLEDFVVIADDHKNDNKVLKAVLKAVFLRQTLNFLSDSAMESLLSVLKKIFQILNEYLQSVVFGKFIEVFPVSMYKSRKVLGINRDDFEKHVICPECDSIYKFDDAYTKIGGIYIYNLNKIEICIVFFFIRIL